VLIDSRVSGNQAHTEGGGVSSEESGVKLVRSLVSGNQARGDGGGLDVEGPVSIRESAVRGNHSYDPDPVDPNNPLPEGGGISLHGGTLNVLRSVIAGNTADGSGGGIATDSPMSIRQSTVKGNVSGEFGGGVFISEGSVSLRSSTVSGNRTNSDGGGVALTGGALSAVNSTLSGNSVVDPSGDGGGIAADGDTSAVNLNAVTIARNSAPDDGGGFDKQMMASTFSVKNSLIALNSAGASAGDCHDATGTVTSRGQNLIGNNIDCPSFSASRGDRVNLDPKIGQLRNNGGLTKTIALKDGSKAIDHAGSDAPGRDQRGVRRNDPGGPDIGAFERN
jgi:hypothetical protein